MWVTLDRPGQAWAPDQCRERWGSLVIQGGTLGSKPALFPLLSFQEVESDLELQEHAQLQRKLYPMRLCKFLWLINGMKVG